MTMKLSARDIGCVRGERRIFAGVSFALASGEGLLLTGANGTGKTSLLRMMAGFLEVAGGTIELTGGSPDLTIAQQAHFVGHLDAVKPGLSVAENIEFWSRLLGATRGIDETLSHFGLSGHADVPAGLLSAGQKRRLALSRLVLVPRPLWLLDEPAVSLDKQSQKRLAAVMSAHLAQGGMVVAATHSALGLRLAHELRLGARKARP